MTALILIVFVEVFLAMFEHFVIVCKRIASHWKWFIGDKIHNCRQLQLKLFHSIYDWEGKGMGVYFVLQHYWKTDSRLINSCQLLKWRQGTMKNDDQKRRRKMLMGLHGTSYSLWGFFWHENKNVIQWTFIL